jgi:hypothetical protein
MDTTNRLNTSLIRPGLLVALKTSLRGGVQYVQNVIEAEHTTEAGAQVARWETTRQIADADEHARASVARSKARSLIASACCSSSFGMLCPVGGESQLQEAIAAAYKVANDFNATARTTRVDVYVLTGRVADSDEAAARAIGAEVRDLLDAMQSGVAAADPKAIRDAATRARELAGMLSDDVASSVSKAIAEVRAVAKRIVKQAGEAGEQAATIVDDIKLEALQSARFAVLDMTGGDNAIGMPAAIAPRAIDLGAPRAIDLDAAPTVIELDASELDDDARALLASAQQRPAQIDDINT